MAYEQEYQNAGENSYLPTDNRYPRPAIAPGAPQPPPEEKAQKNPFNYETARDRWMSGSYGLNEDGVRQWAQEHGINYNGGDSIELPNGGGWIDVIGNFKSGNNMRHTWTPAGGNGPNPNGQPAGPPAYTGFPPTSGLPTNPPPPPGVSAELYNMLLARAKQGTAIDKNDPNIRQQADPYAAAQERARRNYLADAAEGSGPLANLRGEQRVAMERAGQASGLFEAQLIGRELENRRNEIQHALDSLGNRLTEDQRIALQKELGYLSDATSRYGISTGADTASKQIGLGYTQLDWQMDPRNPNNWAI